MDTKLNDPWDAGKFIALLESMMRHAFSPTQLRSYDAIQQRLDTQLYQSPEFLDVLNTCLVVSRDRLRELGSEVSRPDYPAITPFLIYCHDQFEIGRHTGEYELCRCFGRVLGEAMSSGQTRPIHVAEQERRYGLNISFVIANCPRCGTVNRGIPAAAAASQTATFSGTTQSRPNGVAALCNACLEWFVVEWEW